MSIHLGNLEVLTRLRGTGRIPNLLPKFTRYNLLVASRENADKVDRQPLELLRGRYHTGCDGGKEALLPELIGAWRGSHATSMTCSTQATPHGRARVRSGNEATMS